MSESKPLCRCLGVSRETVEQAISIFSADTVEQVARMTEAGTGCMCCRCKIKELIEERRAAARQLEIA